MWQSIQFNKLVPDDGQVCVCVCVKVLAMVADIETGESVESWQYTWFIVERSGQRFLPLAGQSDGNLNPH